MIKKTILEERHTIAALFLYAFLLMFFCSLMSPLYPINDWSDINLYFTIGKAIFDGQTLYTDIFDHKGPLIFVIYGIGSLLSKDSFIGMYFIESLVWGGMITMAYMTARLYLNKIYAFIVAIAFPVLMLSHSSEGGSAEEFIVLFEVISFYLFIRYFKSKEAAEHKPFDMLIHGVLSTIVIFIKINLVVFWFFPLLAIFINLLLKKEYKNLFLNIGTFIIGVLIITVPILIYFVSHNALAYAWDTYIILNKNYAQIGEISGVFENLIIRFYQRLKFDNYEFIIILLGAIYFPIRYIGNVCGKLGLILSFCSLFVIIFMGAGYVFYYSMPYYIFCITGVIVIVDILRKYIRIQPHWYWLLAFAGIGLVLGIVTKDFFGRKKEIILRKEAPKDVLHQFNNIVSQENDPTLMCLGLDATVAIFTMSDIIPNVKYCLSPNLPYTIYPDMRDKQTEYIRNKEVQFIVLPAMSLNYDYFKSLSILKENYDIVNTFAQDGNTTYLLYKRKE